jgi:hypothetical protein
MPSLDRKFGVLTIGHGLPARSKCLVKIRLNKVFIDRLRGNAIDARAQRLIGNEVVGGVSRGRIHLDGLGYRSPG